MTDREKMIALCEDVILSCKASLCADCEHNNIDYPHCMGVHFADHLLANGVVVREKGEWHPDGTFGPHHMENVFCPVCKRLAEGSINDNFCPNCGADMRKGENG